MCTKSPTAAPTNCVPYYNWDEERAEELCPSVKNYGFEDKRYGTVVCSDDVSETKQEALEDSLANSFYFECISLCVYDYWTVISNILSGSVNQGGFIWMGTCWKWVTENRCFTAAYNEYEAVMHFAKEECAVW